MRPVGVRENRGAERVAVPGSELPLPGIHVLSWIQRRLIHRDDVETCACLGGCSIDLSSVRRQVPARLPVHAAEASHQGVGGLVRDQLRHRPQVEHARAGGGVGLASGLALGREAAPDAPPSEPAAFVVRERRSVVRERRSSVLRERRTSVVRERWSLF